MADFGEAQPAQEPATITIGAGHAVTITPLLDSWRVDITRQMSSESVILTDVEAMALLQLLQNLT